MSTYDVSLPDGIEIQHNLVTHSDAVNRFKWSPDGCLLASPSSDRTICVWECDSGTLRFILEGHMHIVRSVAWSPDGLYLASASDDHTIRIWDIPSGRLIKTLEGHDEVVLNVAWSVDGSTIVSNSYDNQLVFWDFKTGRILNSLITGWIYTFAFSPNGELLALGGTDSKLRIWGVKERKFVRSFLAHNEPIYSASWSPDSRYIATGSGDRTIRIWDVNKDVQTHVLEGCAGTVTRVSFSYDGRFLASGSRDNYIRLWRCDSWESVAEFHRVVHLFSGLAFHPKESLLAVPGEKSSTIQFLKIDPQIPLKTDTSSPAVHYTNAKVVLIGDTGVGKTGLGLVLIRDSFKATESTHGRHVWTFADRKVNLQGDRVETRETLLWDLAGQPGYRLIHQLHLEDVSVALVVFDAKSETDPFAGVRHWERALRQANRLRGDAALPMKKFLVAARCDRGGIGVSRERMERFVQELEFDEYFETSAKEGWMIDNLVQAIESSIMWDAMPKVSSSDLFQSIKEYLVEQKETGRLLSSVEDLFHSYQVISDQPSTVRNLRVQFETCVRLIESRGLIKQLSFGDLILLQPELLDAYASSMINAAKDEPDGLGCIAEEVAKLGRFRMPEDERIPNREQEKLLLLATIENMLRHEIALRENVENEVVLVFPSQFTREHPEFPDPQGKALVLSFEGPVLNVYSTLAVRLTRSGIFKRKGMWRNAATYISGTGGICGIFLREIKEGSGTITVFFEPNVNQENRLAFESYVLAHLQRRAIADTVKYRRIVACPNCGVTMTDNHVRLRLDRGHKLMSCPVCDAGVPLHSIGEDLSETQLSIVGDIDRAANANRELEAGLVSAAGEVQTKSFKDWAGSTDAILAIVFTDIIGSTFLNTSLGNEAMTDVRRKHFEQARKYIQHYKGYEIKTIGDSLMVAFRTVTNALDFSLALFSRTGHERIKIKAGIHVGPVLIEEEDAFGNMVNYTSRVIGQAKRAEIWISAEAKKDIDQEKARRHGKLVWIECPDCDLNGFEGKHTLWSVVPPQ